MANREINIGLKAYDDLFKTDNERKAEEIIPVQLSELKPFSEQPFKVLEDDSMTELVESIKENGVLSPIVVRPHHEGGYEILSGHRRRRACEIAGLTEVPIVIKELDDDNAIILLVDSNLQREHILPSEKAKAYQMKLEAMKRKAGRPSKENSVQIGQNLSPVDSRKELASQLGESPVQVQRYIRLTNLIDPLLEMVDSNSLAMNSAVELSYLSAKQQAEVLDVMDMELSSPSIEQAKKIRKIGEDGMLDFDSVLSIMQEEKIQQFKVTFTEDRLRKYFPKGYTKKQIEEAIIKMLENMYRKKQHEMER